MFTTNKINNIKVFNMFFLFILCFSLVVQAVADDPKPLVDVQKKLQTTFSNLNIVDFRPSPIPGLFEINLGNRILYYHPEKDLLIFGEIFNKEGVSLTGEALARQAAVTLQLDVLSSGLLLGATEGLEIVEFVDPDCPYSQRADGFFRSLSSQYSFRRKIFFDLRSHPQAKEKAIHVLSSPNPDKALLEIFSGESVEFLRSKDAEKILEKHAMAAEKLGISGTPSFFVSGEIISGFQPEALMDRLQSQQLTNKKENQNDQIKK